MRRPEKERGQPEEVGEREVEESEARGVQEENGQRSDGRLGRGEHPDEAREWPARPLLLTTRREGIRSVGVARPDAAVSAVDEELCPLIPGDLAGRPDSFALRCVDRT